MLPALRLSLIHILSRHGGEGGAAGAGRRVCRNGAEKARRAVGAEGSAPAVSYTHLDVYKRQTLGQVVDALDAEIEGEPVEIGCNNRYLLDALRYSRCDKLVFEDVYKRQLLQGGHGMPAVFFSCSILSVLRVV